MEPAGTLSEQLADRARRSQGHCALITNGQRISYGELDRQADAAAGWLTGLGITAGDRVAVWMVNRVEWLALLFGASRIGATLVAVNTRYRAGSFSIFCLIRCPPSGSPGAVPQYRFSGVARRAGCISGAGT